MFTGLIETIGTVTAVQQRGDGVRLSVQAPKILTDVQHGDSIAVNGVCLTVIDYTAAEFSADVMQQTLDVSSLAAVHSGQQVNLERAAKLGSRLGGHIVQGHVDGIATVTQVRPGDKWQVIRFSLPAEIAPLLVDKGSITVNGVSLTISNLAPVQEKEQWFEVSLIPETLTATTMGALQEGDRVNLETDIVARHVARLAAFSGGGSPHPATTTAAPQHTGAAQTATENGAEA